MSGLWLLTLLLSVRAWVTPQPDYSSGLLVNYGGQSVVQANADWHGYDLAPFYNRCGLASISPAMLGQVAWVRTPGHGWFGPCLVVDVVGRADAYESIYVRHEIAEIPDWLSRRLGFRYGAPGFIYFGLCPPRAGRPQVYAPPLSFDTVGEHTPSFYPYPDPQMPVDCVRPGSFRGRD